MSIVEKVKATIDRYHLVRKGDRVLMGVSGGPDSVALLHILLRLRYDLGISLSVAHLNHQLRKSSLQDERFLRKLCDQSHLAFHAASLKKGELKRRGSLEEAARGKRLQFFFRVARHQNAQAIALGHTQDDLAETVLMRLIRGTGLMGLRGILPERKIRGFRVIRPLLEISRKEIEFFLKKEKIKFRLDPTNRSTKFFRNKIRLRLLPTLEKEYHKNIKRVLAGLSQTLASDYDYLETQAQNALEKILRRRDDRSLTLRLRPLKSLPVALERMVIRLAIEQLKGDMNQIQLSHFRELEALIHNRPEV